MFARNQRTRTRQEHQRQSDRQLHRHRRQRAHTFKAKRGVTGKVLWLWALRAIVERQPKWKTHPPPGPCEEPSFLHGLSSSALPSSPPPPPSSTLSSPSAPRGVLAMFAPSSSGSRRPSVVAGPSTPDPPALRTPPLPRPRGGSYSRPQPILHTQPATVRLNPSALRSLLRRLTHPPPPPTPAHGNSPTKGKGKERARWLSGWTLRIQPEPNVKLEDVLDRKHLPPLGLKDFEEWLLFVEGTPENLYVQ